MKISVITVSYNSADTIADTIHSVARQTHLDIEHLVIDGLSTDHTIEVVEGSRHPNLVLSSEPDQGIYEAMNKGLARATGEVIGFLNADDIYADADALARIARTFETNPQIEACFGDLVYVTRDNLKVVRYWKSEPFQNGFFARGWAPAHPTFYIRRSALNRLGQFDLSYRLAADAEFMMRYLKCGGVISAYIPYVQVRMRLGGVSNQSWRNILRQNQEILQAYKKNKIHYYLPLFIIHKLINRIWQRFSGSNKMEQM